MPFYLSVRESADIVFSYEGQRAFGAYRAKRVFDFGRKNDREHASHREQARSSVDELVERERAGMTSLLSPWVRTLQGLVEIRGITNDSVENLMALLGILLKRSVQ